MQSYPQSQPRSPRQNTPNSNERHPKRQKVRLACRECRDRKTRCDGRRPCDACIRKKLPPDQCVYSGLGLEPDISYVTSLESRIKHLEAVLGQPINPNLTQNIDSHPAMNWTSTRPESFYRNVSPAQEAASGSGLLFSPSPSIRQSDCPVVLPSDDSCSPTRPQAFTRFPADRHAASISTQSTRVSGNLRMQDHNIEVNDGSVPDPGTENNPKFLGSSSAVGFMTEVYQTFKPGNEQVRNSATQESASPHKSGHTPSSWVDNSDIDVSIRLSSPEYVIPLRNTADSLLDSYWVGAHPLQPFIYRPSFMTCYNRLWNSSLPANVGSLHDDCDTAPNSEQVFHCKLNLVFALGCRFRSLSTQQQDPALDKSQQTFFARATRLLNLEIMDTGSMQLVQALLLMAQYLQTMDLSNRCWVVVGMAVRVAQAVALHLDIDGESQAKREERRRTWYFCILLDRVQGIAFGRPLMLENPPLAQLPQMVDDEYLTTDPNAADGVQPLTVPAKLAYFVSVIELSNITSAILQLVYSPVAVKLSKSKLHDNDYNSLLKLDSELLKWQQHLPPHLHYHHHADISNPNDLHLRQSHLLHHRFLNARILLFRRLLVQVAGANISPSTPDSLQQAIAATCVEICVSAATELLDVIEPNIGTWLVPPAWFTVFLIYTAGTVLAVVFLTPTLGVCATLQQMEVLRRSWSQCIGCLERYEQLGAPAVVRCLWNLHKIYGESDLGRHEPRPQPHRNDTAPQRANHKESLSAGATDFPLSDPWWPHDDIDWLIDLATLNQRGL